MNSLDFNNQPAKSGLAIDESVESGSGYILITGATGLVGQFLVKDLLLKKQKLALLVRPTQKQNAQQRVEAFIQRWETELGCELPRPIVLQGDLKNERLSLADENVDWVKQYCDRIIHNAAVLNFNGASRDDEPWTTNLNGTKNVLSFINRSEIKELHFVSTAYVSGICDTTFKETDFDLGQGFRNDYERSKFEAEKLVRNATGLKSKTIYRPSVISGDSKTGYTPSYHGIYVYLRLMATMIPLEPVDEDGIRRISIKLPMQGDEPRNLVAVDWVSAIMSRIVCDPELHNETYHLVPAEHITARKLVHYSYDFFNSTGTTFADDEDPEYEHSKFASTYLDNMDVYADYEQTDPQFDRSNVEKVSVDLPCPVIDKEVVFKYYQFGIEQRWGKRKSEPAEFECWLSKHAESIYEAIDQFKKQSNQSNPSNPYRIGLNVQGPGGGQWTLETGPPSRPPKISPGIAADTHLIVGVSQNTRPPSEVDPRLGRKFLELLNNLELSKQNSARILT